MRRSSYTVFLDRTVVVLPLLPPPLPKLNNVDIRRGAYLPDNRPKYRARSALHTETVRAVVAPRIFFGLRLGCIPSLRSWPQFRHMDLRKVPNLCQVISRPAKDLTVKYEGRLSWCGERWIEIPGLKDARTVTDTALR